MNIIWCVYKNVYITIEISKIEKLSTIAFVFFFFFFFLFLVR